MSPCSYIRFLYPSVLEDFLTGFTLHCKGCTTVYNDPPRPQFLGTAITSLHDLLNQSTRWSSGLAIPKTLLSLLNLFALVPFYSFIYHRAVKTLAHIIFSTYILTKIHSFCVKGSKSLLLRLFYSSLCPPSRNIYTRSSSLEDHSGP